MKKAFLILFTFSVLFNTACKKDSQINPPTIEQPIVITPTPPVKITDTVYPNPFHGTFTIETNSTDSQTIQMYDLTGREVLNLIINGTTAIVDNSLTNGVYILEITNKTGRINKKLIKN